MKGVSSSIIKRYQKETNVQVKILDGFLLCTLLTGIIQATYCLLITTFPFNAFLSGFLCTVGVFVLTGNLNSKMDMEKCIIFNH